MRQISASKLALLLQCPRPFDDATDVEEESAGEAAHYGSAFHEAFENFILDRKTPLAATLEFWGLPSGEGEVRELDAHVLKASKCLSSFIAGDNPWGAKYNIGTTEEHRAWYLRKNAQASRVTGFEPKTHTYELSEYEIGATHDLILNAVGAQIPRRIVVDYKTGQSDFSSPSTMPQMQALAIVNDADAVAILSTPRDAAAIMIAECVEEMNLKAFARDVRVARSRVGSGLLRTGPECRWCHAKDSCPAKVGDLMVRAEALATRTLGKSDALAKGEIDLGKAHMLFQQLEALIKQGKAEIRARVSAGEIVERPDGTTLQFETRYYERLSKKSVLEAMGQKKGNAMLEKLRKAGALSEEPREELRAKK